MAENSRIEWTHHTFNPWMGCTKVSPACQHCYAERDMDHRYGKVKWGPTGTRVKTSDAYWKRPLKWNLEAESRGIRYRVFCASLADVFETFNGYVTNSKGDFLYDDGEGGYTPEQCGFGDIPAPGQSPISLQSLRKDLFDLIDATPHLDWLLLTKRPENVERMWQERVPVGNLDPIASAPYGHPMRKHRANVLLGTSIENQEWTDKRLPYLHAAKRNGLVNRTFVSAEPLVGPVILHGERGGLVYRHLGGDGLDWVITGGESGPNARACNPDWFRSLRDQCQTTGTAFHFKQWGEFDASQCRVGKKNAGRLLDGRTHDGFPNQCRGRSHRAKR